MTYADITMTPSKEDSIAAAEQLGPIAQLLCVCLLCCVLALGFLWRPRRKVAGEKCQLIAKNWTPAKFCSACGEESDTVKLCKRVQVRLVLRQGMSEQRQEGAYM